MLIWETEIAHLWFSVESIKTIGIELKRKKIERGSKGLLLWGEGVSMALLSRRGKGRDRVFRRQRGRSKVTTGQRADQHQHQHGRCSPGRVGKGAVSQDGGEIRSS